MTQFMQIVMPALVAVIVALALVVAKLLRDERRRESARVAMLAQMADEASAEIADIANPLDAGDLELRQAATSDLFAPVATDSAWPSRLGVVAGLALVLAGSVIALRYVPASVSPTQALSPQAPASQTALLDLLSLKHVQREDGLTITGLVQNPRDGEAVSKVTATAFLFGADGTFLASGRAPLDFTILRPGDESAFVVDVPLSAPVARYRVGFRRDDGSIIGHVDRRTSGPVARGPS
jgi:hypothetical protein